MRIYLLPAIMAIFLVACGQSDETRETSAVPARETAAAVQDSVIRWLPFAFVQKTFPRARKPIFLYLYQDACDHCTHMDSAVFGRPEIARYLNANFIPVKVDPYIDPPFNVHDSLMSAEDFRQILGIESTPAYYFFDRDGRVAGLFQNEIPQMVFKRMLVYIQDGHFGRTPYAEFKKLPVATDEAIDARF
jgi:thioredoxin-related protein